MRAFKKNRLPVFVLLFLFAGALILIPSQGIAQGATQGDVALKMVEMLGLTAATAEDAIALLEAEGIVPQGGWDVSASATSDFVGALYTAVNNAITQGKITPPAALGNASSLVSAAATAAGMPSTVVVNAVVAAGGDQTGANQGATFGSAAAAAAVGAPAGSTGAAPPAGGSTGGGAGGGGTSPSS